jgi:RimJ/RimL family protein N-acetyltransferase
MNLKNIEGLKNELNHMWGDVDKFFEFGFGVCALFNDSLAGWCLGEYFSSYKNIKHFGIGIETYSEFQRKGIAFAMASLLVELGLEKNYDIYWDSYSTNIASIKTARKVGFELEMEYEILHL